MDFHVLASDWSGSDEFELDGEVFQISVAKTPFGIFGRCVKYWNEAKANSLEEVIEGLKKGLQPLLDRQRAIGQALGMQGRCTEEVRKLSRSQLVRLLYCRDRDAAAEAQKEIEKQASSGLFTEALIHILDDRTHPLRRIAQWCVLDMFEDLPAFCRSPEDEVKAVAAIRDLVWSANDDYARTIYKAGVVLGGHVCSDQSAEALLACMFAPSRVGRRSAMHAVFHLAEWMPEKRDLIVEQLTKASKNDSEPLLRTFAACMARDIETKAPEHVTEPMFPEEAD
jgi:hypothetical protein